MSSYEYVCNLLEIESDSWYSRVRVRQSWEEEQGHVETDWGELFFDLNYVAMVHAILNMRYILTKRSNHHYAI